MRLILFQSLLHNKYIYQLFKTTIFTNLWIFYVSFFLAHRERQLPRLILPFVFGFSLMLSSNLVRIFILNWGPMARHLMASMVHSPEFLRQRRYLWNVLQQLCASDEKKKSYLFRERTRKKWYKGYSEDTFFYRGSK